MLSRQPSRRPEPTETAGVAAASARQLASLPRNPCSFKPLRVTPSTGPVFISQVRKARSLSTNRRTAASLGNSRVAPGCNSEEWKNMVSTRPPRRRWR